MSANLDSLLEQTELEITVGTAPGCLWGRLRGLLLGVIGGSGRVMSLVLAVLFGTLPIFYVSSCGRAAASVCPSSSPTRSR